MARLISRDVPPPRRTAHDIQGQPLIMDQRVYAFSGVRVDAAPEPRQGNLFASVSPAGESAPPPAVVDLDAGEYKDITDGRSAGDPPGGT
ncbi:hypothetical protein [Phreatobacter oligotrophus]|uniref:Uncharacterized protein n=1 Tax=Phreatobacter oligotrophus TaxID=1122261 RepID=A0A2T4ZIT2_9HYPH|nr:hypothetical protein [Phreatobacter oligotrophus]PTM61889.1 hypothetical protein C8P69_101561 [Phreatobacter oligotrophus]